MAYTGNPLITTNYIADLFSGNGIQTNFVLTQAPANVNGIIVFVNNQASYPNTYSVTGQQLTFVSAPVAGTGNISVRYLGAAGTPYVPGPLSVQNSMIANGFILPITQGGTGAINQQAAINALSGTGTSGTYLRSNGTNVSLTSIQASDVPTLNQNTTGNAATATLATTATTANALNTANNYQVNSLGVGTGPSGTVGEIRATNNITGFYSSDQQFKENIQDIHNALDIVCQIGCKTFDWTDLYISHHGGDDGFFINKQDFGVIAQDVEKCFPMAVRTREDGTKAVDYQKLWVLSFGAIQQLVRMIEDK